MTHRVAAVSPLATTSCRSSFRSGKIALKNATLCLKPGRAVVLAAEREHVGCAMCGHEWGRSLIVVSFSLCDCGPGG
jgi:hypothetical protein